MDDRAARELTRQLARNTEMIGLAAYLNTGIRCDHGCNRFATRHDERDNFSACDEHAAELTKSCDQRGSEPPLYRDLVPQGQRARRFEQLLRDEG